MILVLLILALCVFVMMVFWEGGVNDRIATFTICLFIWGFLFVVPIVKSYTTYLPLRAFYDVTVNQYRDSITLYKTLAVIDVEDSMTDFRYEGYQESISRMIIDLREKITWYNNAVVIKRKLKANPFFDWFIIAPDKDMKLLALKE